MAAFARKQHIETLCVEAKKYGFASVCMDPCNIPLAGKLLNAGEEQLDTSAGAQILAEAQQQQRGGLHIWEK